ncbi:PEP-CTERM sorting domain-containing protein [Roseateles toxinivorans]|uniref:Putative secreted protein with PEP-CTERM sorting signal n=1 Tax=Roseateles toxinivorans TaxID=270368 RepID=A0A4R6QGH0_9BURK|nr:PEP-CTERM sorting domain-containing protein [Roseateles toxinivorans]TDP62136.1 putative secreted protein with PEP-CTERM sorting signal [Roseateles toxinivorans]
MRIASGPLLLSAALMLPALPSQAAMLDIATVAHSSVFVRDCRSAEARAANAMLPDKCEATAEFNLVDTMVEQRYVAALGGNSATIQATHAAAKVGGKVSQGSVDGSGALGQIVIKQGSFTQPYARVSSWTDVLQSYAWDGSGAATRTLGGTLDFNHVGMFGSDAFNATGTAAAATVDMTLSVFSLTTSTISVDTELVANQVYLYEEFALGLPGYRREAWVERFGEVSPVSFGATFSLEQGRTYFVEARVAAFARFGGALDATHTFSASITDLQGLTQAQPLAQPYLITNVPEPGSALMLLAGLLGLGCARGSVRRG